MITRSEILANRQKWIDYLKRPETKKETHRLENPMDTDARCCLGHACYILGAERVERHDRIEYFGNENYTPHQIVEELGLYDRTGRIIGSSAFDNYTNFEEFSFYSLSVLNDMTDITPQKIGEYLESVIEGGEKTPLISLSEYPE